MNAEDLARKARRDAPWDDLRERRVLARVLAEQKRPSKAPRYAMGAIAAIVAAAAIVFLVVRMRAPATPLATSAPAEQTMVLADGSQAVMLRDAGVQIEEQSKDRVRIAQARGAVRYEVRHDPAREFIVRAAGTTVCVRGTVFVVDVAGDSVEVRVDRGRVEVDDGTRTRDLVAGEVLRVPARAQIVTSPDPEPNDSASQPSARPTPSASPAPPTAAELQSKADAARLSGNLGDAASALETLIARYPRDGRVPAALFSLGRVERARGRHAASAQAFERCARSGGALAQDALAEAAASWSSAGATDAARADATAYLARYPNGPHAARMKAIAGP